MFFIESRKSFCNNHNKIPKSSHDLSYGISKTVGFLTKIRKSLENIDFLFHYHVLQKQRIYLDF